MSTNFHAWIPEFSASVWGPTESANCGYFAGTILFALLKHPSPASSSFLWLSPAPLGNVPVVEETLPELKELSTTVELPLAQIWLLKVFGETQPLFLPLTSCVGFPWFFSVPIMVHGFLSFSWLCIIGHIYPCSFLICHLRMCQVSHAM